MSASHIIDTLMVTLGINTKELKQGSKEAKHVMNELEKKSQNATKEEERAEKKRKREEEKRHKEELEHRKEIAEEIKKTREHIEAFLMIFTGGEELVEFIKNTITSAMEVGFLSQNTDMAVRSIAGFQLAMKDMGGTAEEANNAIERASNAVASFHAGVRNEDLRGLLIAAGGTGVDLTHATRSSMDFLKAQSAVIHALYVKSPQLALMRARTMMHISDNLFNMMKHGPEEMEKLIEEGAKASALTQKRADAAYKVHKAWVETMGTLESIGRNVLLPILQAISNWFKGHEADVRKFGEAAVRWVQKMTPKAIEKFGDALNNVYKGLVLIFGMLQKMKPYTDKLGDFMGGWENFTKPVNIPRHHMSMADLGLIGQLYQFFTGTGSNGNNTTVHFNGGIHVDAGGRGPSQGGMDYAAGGVGGHVKRSMGTMANSSVN